MHMNIMAERKKSLKMDEKEFQKWYSKWAKKTGIDPNPDAPRHYYDYRGAYKEGIEPKIADDGLYHWSSKFKHDLHPNRYIKENTTWIDTKYGEPVSIEDVQMQREERERFESTLQMENSIIDSMSQ